MSDDIPDRIFAWPWNGETRRGQWSASDWIGKAHGATEYARADRIKALEAQNREQALQMLSDAGQFIDLHDHIKSLEARIKAADALADALNMTALIAHALEDGGIIDKWAYVFEDTLDEQNEALRAYREASK